MLTTANVLPDWRGQPLNKLRDFIQERSVLRNGPYRLASGGRSDTFFDMKQSLLDPRGLDLAGEIIADMIQNEDIKAVGGLVIGACPVADVVALKSLQFKEPITSFYVRKDRKPTGTKSLIEGPEVRNSRVIVVDDVTTQGGSVLKVIEAIREEWNCRVDRVITIVDREVGAFDRLKREGIELSALYRMSEFIQD